MTDVKSVIIVQNNEFYLLSKSGDNFKCILKTKAYTGTNGFTNDKKEGDGKTPCGTFDIKFAFGNSEKPETNLKYIKTDNFYYFVDDINSKYYNRLVDIRKDKIDWFSAEHISFYKKEYAYAVDIGYNSECIKGKGSCIFLHCKGNKPYTNGCIAIKKRDMLFCLKHLDNTSKIIIKNPTR